MNIITKSDVEKFVKLLRAGLINGKRKELTTYTSATTYDGTEVVKEYYVSLEFKFLVDQDKVEEAFIEDDFNVNNQINDLLKGM